MSDTLLRQWRMLREVPRHPRRISTADLKKRLDGRTIKLVADFDRPSARWFIERPLDANQVVEDIDEKTVRLTATVLDTQKIRRWLLGFGAGVEVITPVSLRSEISEIVKALQQKYDTY